MGKKKENQIPNKHLHSRISYLHQAAQYLSQVSDENRDDQPSIVDRARDKKSPTVKIAQVGYPGERGSLAYFMATDVTKEDNPPKVPRAYMPNRSLGQSRRFMSHIRAVSLKSLVRLSPSMKHSNCRHCESLLIPG